MGEKKYQSLIEKRNELNDVARLIREERDMLNDKRKEYKEVMDNETGGNEDNLAVVKNDEDNHC